MTTRLTAVLAAFLLAGCARTVVVGSPVPANGFPGLDAIRESDLRADEFAMAGDAMRGREAGTLDELRASMWVAERARAAGLEPAGDDSTFFQFWPMRRTRISWQSRIAVGGTPLALWKDVKVWNRVNTSVDLPLVFVGEGRPNDIANLDLHGKAAVVLMHEPTPAPPLNVSLRAFRYVLAAIAQQERPLVAAGAGAVIIVSDSAGDSEVGWGYAGSGMERGTYGLDTGRVTPAAANPPVLWVRHSMLGELQRPGQRLVANIITETFTYPSVNIVGKVAGTDPSKRNEYVLFSGHQDHDGVRYPIDGDSIWNGADDNASVSVALLAIARAFHEHPAARPALFVWHGAEERGLLGSRWFVLHPKVPASEIVAVLNGDMIGRNNPDSAALLGAQPPHRNSIDLANAALEANARLTHFQLDTTWDRPTHPEFWYFRSDHLPYARAGIPSLFFSTLLHPDYHTPRDEPQRIEYPKLTKMAEWMYATGWIVANAPTRPAISPGFRLER